MREAPTCTTWKMTCASPDDAKALQQWISSRIALDRILTDTIRTMPNGVEKVETVEHRLGDYFAEIRLVPEGSASFGLVFQRKPEAGRFWKDLMVNILQEVERSGQKPAIVVEREGELKAQRPAGKRVSYGKTIDAALTYLSRGEQRKFCKKFRDLEGDQEQLLHARQELLAGVFLARQGYEPTYEHLFGQLTPDWYFSAPAGKLSFLADVVNFHINRTIEVVQNEAMARAGTWCSFLPENGQRLYHSLQDKASKYRALVTERQFPYVIFVYGLIGAALQDQEIKDCLFHEEYGLFRLYPNLSGVFHFHGPTGDLSFVLSVERAGGGHEFEYYRNPYATIKDFDLNSDFLPNDLPAHETHGVK